MARNTFMLNNDGDSIGLVKGDYYVNGGAGAQQLLINSGVTGIEIAGGMERVDFAYNSFDLAFKVNGLQIQILNGSNVIATISTNDTAGGTELAFKNGGLKISLDSSDPQNPAFSLTGANGSSQSIPLNSQENVSLDKSFILNSSLTSNVGGGGTPGTGDDTVTIDLTDLSHKPIPTDGTPYNLIGDVTNINKASYTDIKNASKITIKDDLTDLIDTTKGTLKDDAKKALAIDNVTDVKVIGNLDDLAMTTLPAEVSAKTVSYLINKASMKSTVTLTDATVDEANGAVKQINDFLANSASKTVLDGTTESKLPADFAVTTVKITNLVDTAEAIATADATLLKGAKNVIVEDTVANVIAKSELFKDENVDAVNVEDSLENISNATLLLTTSAKPVTFTANDTGDATLTYESNLVSKGITFNSLEENSVVTLNASAQTSPLTVDLNSVFSFDADVKGATVDYTGGSAVDTITANANGGRIDGGLGADVITLAKGVDTVVLGSGVNTAANLAANTDSISGFDVASDKLDFNGDLLGGFGTDVELVSNANVSLGGTAYDGKIVVVSVSAAAQSGFDGISALFANADGDKKFDGEMILIATGQDSSVTKGKIWYVQSDGTTMIQSSEVTLIATLDGDMSGLTADNFA